MKTLKLISIILFIIVVLFPPTKRGPSERFQYDKKPYFDVKSDRYPEEEDFVYRFILNIDGKIDISKSFYEYTSTRTLDYSGHIIWGIYVLPMIFLFLVFFVIHNYQKKQSKMPTMSEPKVSGNNSSDITTDIQSNQITTEEYVNSISKNFKLLSNHILTKEDYEKVKINLLNDIKQRGIIEKPEDFLTQIIILKENGMLSQDDIMRIKEIIMT